MKQVWQKLFLITFPLTTLGSLAPITSVKAQITPDNTLGAENSVVNRNLTIRGIPSDRIDGGARRGGNLFHSFQEFNVGAGRGAYFSNPTGVDNILTRVTGSNASNILGRLGVLGNANLFFINPNGIVFGQNASLDVRGSFFASTASSLIFNNGFEFSATNPQAPSLLTVNIPIGLRFRDNPGSITVNGFGHEGFDQNGNLIGASDSFPNPTLEVPAGNTLAFVGGNVRLDGGVLQAPGGRVELGGLTAAGTVGINNDNSLSFPDSVARGDVALTNQAGINVITNASSGSININARKVAIDGQSLLTAGIAGGLGEVNYRAGDITLNSTGETTIDQSRIENNVNSGTTANSGNIIINAGTLSLTNGTQLDTSNSGQGNSGNISIMTGSLSLTHGAQLLASTRVQGDAGSVIINARDRVSFDGTSSNGNPSAAFSSVEQTGRGKGGDIRITTGELSLTNGAQLFASTRGQGDAGSVIINARDRVSFDSTSSNGNPSAAFSSVEAGAVGNGSSININAGSLSLTNGGELNTLIRNGTVTVSDGQGIGGDVNINVRGVFAISDNSGVFTSLGSGSKGRGGNIIIQAGSLSLAKDARLVASTFGVGNAGRIDITAGERILLDGNNTAIRSRVEQTGNGKGGDIRITTGELSLTNGAQLSPSTLGQGDAGNVIINARDRVSFDGTNSNGNPSGAFSSVEAGSVGNGGSININAGSLFLTNGGELNTFSRNGTVTVPDGQGIGGDVNINVRGVFAISDTNSGVFTSLGLGSKGRGGNINIQAGSFSVANDAQLSAGTRGQGNAGNINVQANGNVSLNIPIGLRFRDNPGSITVNGFGQPQGINGTSSPENPTLAVDPGKTLALVGGNVSLDGGVLQAQGGLVELGGLTAAGTVSINSDHSLIFPDGVERASVSLKNSSNIDVSGGGSGSIAINARNLDLQYSSLTAEISQSSDTPSLRAGDITVNATETITLGQSSQIESRVLSNATANGNNINITTGSLSIMNASEVNTFTFGQGNAGNVNINARDTVSFDGASNGFASGIVSVVRQQSTGNAGNISINTGTLSLTNGAVVDAISIGQGTTGSVTINATDGISLDGPGSGVFNLLNSSNGIGNSGGIRITAGTLSVTNGAQLNSSTSGMGNAGDVTIDARDRVSFNQGSVFTSANSRATGKGGDISITSGDISLANGSQINLSTTGQGNAGNISINTETLSLTNGAGVFASSDGQGSAGSVTINARDGVSLDGANGIYTSNSTNSIGNNGGIRIKAGTLSVTNAQLNSSTSGMGNAGDVTIDARDRVSFNQGRVITSTNPTATGKGGDISITSGDISLANGSLIILSTNGQGNAGNAFLTTRSLSLTDRSELTLSTTGQGNAGNAFLTTRSLSLTDLSRLTASSNHNSPENSSAIGNGGNINLQIGDLLLLRGQSLISTSAGSDAFTGNSGNITINAPLIVAFPSNNDITANAFSGIGGQVIINTQGLFGIAPLSRAELERRLNTTDPSQLNPNNLLTSDITAISQQSPSLNGTVDINSSYLNPSQNLVELPKKVVDPTTQIAQNPCQHGAGSTFAITGRGGIPSNPNQTLAGDNVRVGLVTPVSSRGTATTTATLPSTKPTVKQAVPVQGWVFNDKGQVVLTAYDPTKTGSQRPWRTSTSCAKQ